MNMLALSFTNKAALGIINTLIYAWPLSEVDE